MNRFLTRLFLVAMLLCGFFDSRTGVKAQSIVDNVQKNESDEIQQIRQGDGWLKQVAEEPQSPAESALRITPSSHRVASSRPSRLLPTHGGKPGHHHARWSADGCGPLQTSPGGGLTESSHAPGRASSSPRFYYVIALRRLLC